MLFGSPNWLLGIIAWLAITVWMLWGRWPRAAVPYLPLWMTGMVAERPRRSFEIPPAAIAAMLGAGFLAILAASEPALVGRAGMGQTVTLIVDRGLSMSAVVDGGFRRYVQAAAAADSAINDVAPGAKIIVKFVPPAQGSGVESVLPSAMVDPDALALAVRRELVNTPGLVVLVSDQIVPVEDPRFVQIPPDEALNGAGIDSLNVAGSPHPQAMVRITNDSPATSAKLTMHSDGATLDVPIELPSRGEAKNYFVDLPSDGKVIEAELTADGDALMDQRAWAVQRSGWPLVVPQEGVGPELRKMIGVYAHLRPASPGAQVVKVSASTSALGGEETGAAWPLPRPDDEQLQSGQSVLVAPGPLSTKDVNWDEVLSDATAAQSPPSGDWQPVVTAGKVVVVAVRTQPVRQSWVGFHSAEFPNRADFVIFWSEVFDWLGNAGPVYVSRVEAQPDGEWTPELYKGEDGLLEGFNAPPLPGRFVDHLDWRANLAKLPTRLRVGERPIGGVLLLLALVMVCVAAASWRTG